MFVDNAAVRQASPEAAHEVALTNLGKVLYPESGTTKGEVIDYFTRIAPVLLPHLAGRPVTRKRWPDGVTGGVFFQKDIGRGAPQWIRTQEVTGKTSTVAYVLIDNSAGLVWLGQSAALELHVPQWRFAGEWPPSAEPRPIGAPSGVPENPDRLVLDFDPGEGVGLAECAQVALQCRVILDGMGIPSIPVTSGSKGIHLYAPLGASGGPGAHSADAVSALAHELARHLEADDSNLVVSDMAKVKRVGKVLVDWSQNNGKKTTISPYSLRGVAEPFVVAPRTWAELLEPKLANLTYRDVLDRVKKYGDLLSPLLSGRAAD